MRWIVGCCMTCSRGPFFHHFATFLPWGPHALPTNPTNLTHRSSERFSLSFPDSYSERMMMVNHVLPTLLSPPLPFSSPSITSAWRCVRFFFSIEPKHCNAKLFQTPTILNNTTTERLNLIARLPILRRSFSDACRSFPETTCFSNRNP